MANALYGKAKQKFLEGGVAFLTDTIKIQLIDVADYVVNLATHEFLVDVPVAARVGTAVALATKTSAGGVADAADVTFTAVTGDPSEALIIYKDTGAEGTSALIAYIDTATGLPVTPNGGNIVVAFDDGANKIFAL